MHVIIPKTTTIKLFKKKQAKRPSAASTTVLKVVVSARRTNSATNGDSFACAVADVVKSQMRFRDPTESAVPSRVSAPTMENAISPSCKKHNA